MIDRAGRRRTDPSVEGVALFRWGSRPAGLPQPGRALRRSALVLTLSVLVVALSGCAWVQGLFGGKQEDKGVQVSVFTVAVGDCFVAPTDVKAELSDLNRVACSAPHQQEAYALIPFKAAGGSDTYPGEDALSTFAQGACAQAFAGYVGIDYPDSSLYFTYLLPSARGWQQSDDRTVICFVTTTGQSLTKSVKGSKM